MNPQATNSPFDLNKAALFDALAASGITQIVVCFDGYGDSGQIEDTVAKIGDEAVTMPEAMIEFIESYTSQNELSRSNISIGSVVETLAYDILRETHDGWMNEDGAYGDFVFDVAERTITLGYNERYTCYEHSLHVL